MAKKKLDLVSQAKKQVPKDPRNLRWVDRLPDEQRQALNDLREAYHAGHLAGWIPKTIYEQLVLGNGLEIGVGYATFRAWLSGYDGKKAKN